MKKAECQSKFTERAEKKIEQAKECFGHARPVSAKAKKVLEKLEGMMIDGYAKIDNDTCFMPVIVEKIAADEISVAHYYEQNGDLMASPEIVFLKKEYSYGVEYYPVYERIDGMGFENQLIEFNEQGKIVSVLRSQRDTASFCTIWMCNIKEQQGIV